MKDAMGDVGKRLCVAGMYENRQRIDKFALETKGGAGLKESVVRKMADEIRGFVCAECANCPHMKMEFSESEDFARMQQNLSIRATCEKVKARTGSAECPDGFHIFERGWKAGVKTESFSSVGGEAGRVVTGFEYSETSSNPLTMNHLTVKERYVQCNELIMACERGTAPAARYDRTADKTVFQMPEGAVTFHQDGTVRVEGGFPAEGHRWPEGAKIRPASFEAQTFEFPKNMTPSDFNREYLGDFSARDTQPPPFRLPPKDVPLSPDTGTW